MASSSSGSAFRIFQSMDASSGSFSSGGGVSGGGVSSSHERSREMAASSGGVSAPQSSHAGPEACDSSQEKAVRAEMQKLDTRLWEHGLRAFFYDFNNRMVGNSKGASPQFCGPGLGVGYF